MKKRVLTKKNLAILCLLLVGAVGLSFAFLIQPSRLPASIPSQGFFDSLKPSQDFHASLKSEIVNSLQVAKNQKEFQIQLRNFLVKGGDTSEPLCTYFNSLKLTFEAEGIASNGVRPTLTITQPCLISDRTKLPEPIRIPIEDIVKLKPSDTDISFKISQNTLFSFRDIYGAWPEYWVLSQVEFDHSEKLGKRLVIERREIFQISKKIPTMDWATY